MEKPSKKFIVAIIILSVLAAALAASKTILAIKNRQTDVNFDHPYPLAADDPSMYIHKADGGILRRWRTER